MTITLTKVEHGMLNPDFIPTWEMIADCLTKSVPAPKVRREQMGVWLEHIFPCIQMSSNWGVPRRNLRFIYRTKSKQREQLHKSSME